MTIPTFGLTAAERTASVLLALVGTAGLVLIILGYEAVLAVRLLGEPLPVWFVPNARNSWLVIQSVLVILGGTGVLLWRRCFTVAAIGIIAGLIFVTPVGLLTALPSLWMLLLVVPRRRAFSEFTPRWRGQGPPPPGQWR